MANESVYEEVGAGEAGDTVAEATGMARDEAHVGAGDQARGEAHIGAGDQARGEAHVGAGDQARGETGETVGEGAAGGRGRGRGRRPRGVSTWPRPGGRSRRCGPSSRGSTRATS